MGGPGGTQLSCLPLRDGRHAARVVDDVGRAPPVHSDRFPRRLVVAAPLAGASVGAFLGGLGSVAASAVGIRDDFVREVEALMKPGTSALFVLDGERDMDVILHSITRGWV